MAKIYLISPESIILSEFKVKLQNILSTNKVSVFQLRLKNCEKSLIKEAAQELLPVCLENNVPLIINDHFDIALEVGASGVHLGVDDVNNLSIIKKAAPDGFVIGISCYDSRDLALDGVIDGADYISFGAFYQSNTKKSRGKPDLSILKWADEMFDNPVVAIGGINDKNCKALSDSGANFVAIISYIWDSEDGEIKAVDRVYKSLSGN